MSIKPAALPTLNNSQREGGQKSLLESIELVILLLVSQQLGRRIVGTCCKGCSSMEETAHPRQVKGDGSMGVWRCEKLRE
jgi:hypothetical protein